jgi:hypothetical protein
MEKALEYFNKSIKINENHSLSVYGVGIVYFT